MLLNPCTMIDKRVFALSRTSCSMLPFAVRYDRTKVTMLMMHITMVRIARNLFFISD